MPYISQELRERLDPLIEELSSKIGNLCEPKDKPTSEPDGMLNYVFTRLLHDLPRRNYTWLERAIGILECCKLELYRREVAPYEDMKAAENGDVYEG